ncbi:cation transporter [Flavobacterium gelidilacus]|uniref:heavy-metal-associated domain-containing protein n=1 Tax=Flavobacterium gelidilacus TaxID=206041 RepID=UPI001FE1A332|nr:cation transporter [Flavobacterium gelidilacus]
MKKSLLKVMLAIVVLLSTTMNAQIKNTKTEEVKISGNCGMCKKTIEKAGNIKDIASVDWNKETKIATLIYDAKKTNQEEILKRIASAGYDSEKISAPDAIYNNLPGCCQYDRTAKENSKDSKTVATIEKVETVKISGNCGMCKKTIEKAGTIEGISKVEWNKETKIATLTYDDTKTNKDEILKRIAKAGYDSELFKAKDKDYDNLPGCCQYDRE